MDDTFEARFSISIIEDSEIHREWLKLEISDHPKLKLLSIDQSGREGLKSVKLLEPDLVILDFQLEDITGLEVSKRIKNHNNRIKIFALTAHTEHSIIERIVNEKNIDA